MKHLSIFQTVLLSVFGALAISGVLIFALAVGGNQESPVGPVSIWGTLDAKAFAAAIEKAAGADARFAQVTYVEKDPTTYEADITNALANGGGPDLFLLRQDYIMRDKGKVIPVKPESLSSTQFKATFIDAANTFDTAVGALGYPLFVDPLILYWNRDLLASGGFAKPPAYWEELSDMTQKLTKRSDSGAILKSTIALGEYTNVTNAKSILSVRILQEGGSITERDQDGRLTPAFATGTSTESALSFYTQFANPANNAGYTWNRSLPDARTAFAAGDTALYIGYVSEAPLIAQMNPNLSFAVAPLPQIRGRDRAVNTARVYALAVSRAGENQNGAKVVAPLFASPSIAKDIGDVLGIPSALRDVLSEPAEGNGALFNKEAIIARSWLDPDPEKTSAIFRAMIERVTSGAMRLSDAIQRADQEMAQVIGQ